MNLGQGSLRLFLVVFLAWSVFCGVDIAAREIGRADQAYAADCQIRKQTIAQFDLQKCLDDPAAAAHKREQAMASIQSWFADGGYLFWLIPPFLITAVSVILIAAGGFVYRGFTAE
jgi:hypothetical protein